MTNFTDLWTECNDLYGKLHRKGTLVLSGRSGDFEISYVHYADFVMLVEGHPTAEAACEALLKTLRHDYKAVIEARKEALLAELATLEAQG